MKKRILIMMVLIAAGFYIPTRADAFILPPFKIDGGVLGEGVIEGVNDVSTQVQDALSQARAISTKYLQGDGSEFSKLMKFVKTAIVGGVAAVAVTTIVGKIKDLHKQEAAEVNKSNAEIDNATAEADAKVTEHRKNIEEIEKELLFAKTSKEREKLEAKRNKELAKIEEIRTGAKEKIEGLQLSKLLKIKSLNDAIGQFTDALKNKASELLSSWKKNKVDENYNAAEDLEGTNDINNVPAGTPETSTVAIEKGRSLKRVFGSTLKTVTNRITVLRTSFAKNDETSDKTTEASASAQGADDSMIIAAIESKKQVMLALVDYTEMLLHRLKLQATYDMATGAFQAFDKESALSEFDFNKYRFNPDDVEIEEGEAEMEEAEDGDSVEGSLKKASKEIFKDSSEQGEKE